MKTYVQKLIDDMMEKFPSGKLPPVEKVTQRRKEKIEAVLKGFLKGGRHIYILGYPV